MEINVLKLKKTIAEKNTTMEGVAAHLGIDRSTLYRKLRDGAKGVTVCEARSISSFLGLTYDESASIFWIRR